MKCVLILAAVVLACVADQPALFQPALTHHEIMNIIRHHYETSTGSISPFGKRELKEKRFLGGLSKIFHKIEHFATDHLGDLINVGETLGPALLGKREAELEKRRVGDRIKNAFKKVGEYVLDHVGDIITVGEKVAEVVGKRDAHVDKRFLGKVSEAFKKAGNFLKDHVGDIIKVGETVLPLVLVRKDVEQQKRFLGDFKNILHSIEHFAKDHIGDLLTVGETLGPALLGKRDTEEHKRFIGGISKIFHKIEHFATDHLGDLITVGETLGPALLGKREAEFEKRFLGKVATAFKKAGNFLKDHVGDIIKVGETVLPLVLVKKDADFEVYPPVVQEFKQLIDTQKALLQHGHFENTFHGFVDKLNYLDRFTHSHSLERRGFFDNIANTFKNLGSSIKSGAEKVGQFFSAHLGDIASGALKVLPSVIPAAVSLLGKREVADLPAKFGEIVKNDALEIFQKIRDAYEGAMNMSHNLIKGLKESAQKVLGGENIKEISQKVLSVISADIKDMLNKDVFHLDLDKLLGDLIPNAVQKLFGSHINKRFLLSDAGAIIGDLKGLVSNGITGVKDLLSGIVTTAKTAIAPTVQNIKALAATFLSNATQLTAKAASEAVTFFKPFAGVLGPIFTKIQSLAQPLLG